jgi:4-hydroxy-tetrahydrodipicolinate synthase
MPTEQFYGLLVPALTPFRRDLEPDRPRYAALCRWLLDEGAHGLAVFGTTSEANSMAIGERKALLEHLVESGITPGVLMPGTGACALPDAVDLTSHAVKLGCGGALVLPPFYYKNQSDEGFFAYFSELIERVGDPRLKVYLYHFPQMSAAPISLDLIARLRQHYPDTVMGLKDSSGDWAATRKLAAEFPDMAIFPSSEARLDEGLSLGMAGCISASANIQPRAIRALIDSHGTPEAAALNARISTVRAIMERYPVVPGLKALLARDTGHADWAVTRPPITSLPKEAADKLFGELEASGCYEPVALPRL